MTRSEPPAKIQSNPSLWRGLKQGVVTDAKFGYGFCNYITLIALIIEWHCSVAKIYWDYSMAELFHWWIEGGLLVLSIFLWVKYLQRKKLALKWYEHAVQLEALNLSYEQKYREQTTQLVMAKRQLKAMNSEIVEQRELSEQDVLVPILLNKRGGEQKLIRLLDQCLGRKKINLLYMDLDKFKEVNDIYGHENGDEVIKQLGLLIQNELRDQEFGFVFRFGGEEFIAVIPEATDEEMLQIAERLRIGIENHEFLLLDGRILRKTTSIGFAECQQVPSYEEAIRSIKTRRQGEFDETHPSYDLVAKVARELKEKADFYMYHAKHTGRNRVCYYGNYVSLEEIGA